MTFTGCFFALVCALFFLSTILAYSELKKMDERIFKLDKQNKLYREQIARYEALIQSQQMRILELKEEIKNDHEI